MKTFYQQISGRLSRTSDIALLCVRVLIGWLMIMHALLKFQGKGGVAAFQAMLNFLHNVPFPAFTGAVLPWVEVLFGALLILGVLTRIAALALGLEMLIIAFLVKLHDAHVGVIAGVGAPLPGAELEFAFIAALGILLVIGPGKISGDAALGIDGRSAATAMQTADSEPAKLSS